MDFGFEFRDGQGGVQATVLLLALHADELAILAAKEVHTILALTTSAVLPGARVAPEFLPQVEAERFKSRGVIRRLPKFNARKREAKRAELKRLAGGGGGVPSQMLQALHALTLACAQAGFGERTLGPAELEALAQFDGLLAPFPEFSTALRQLAAGQVPSVPAALPAELQHLLSGIVQAIRQAQVGGYRARGVAEAAAPVFSRGGITAK